jgi:hypothetical protein
MDFDPWMYGQEGVKMKNRFGWRLRPKLFRTFFGDLGGC